MIFPKMSLHYFKHIEQSPTRKHHLTEWTPKNYCIYMIFETLYCQDQLTLVLPLIFSKLGHWSATTQAYSNKMQFITRMIQSKTVRQNPTPFRLPCLFFSRWRHCPTKVAINLTERWAEETPQKLAILIHQPDAQERWRFGVNLADHVSPLKNAGSFLKNLHTSRQIIFICISTFYSPDLSETIWIPHIAILHKRRPYKKNTRRYFQMVGAHASSLYTEV